MILHFKLLLSGPHRQHQECKQYSTSHNGHGIEPIHEGITQRCKITKLFTVVRVTGTVAATLPVLSAGATQQAAAAAQNFQKLAEAMITIQAAGSLAKTVGNVATIVADTDATLFKM